MFSVNLRRTRHDASALEHKALAQKETHIRQLRDQVDSVRVLDLHSAIWRLCIWAAGPRSATRREPPVGTSDLGRLVFAALAATVRSRSITTPLCWATVNDRQRLRG